MTEAATRSAYDSVAVLYADMFRDVLDDMPLDRALLAAFAEMTRDSGPIADLGCGPGRLTGHLASLGLPVFGVDLSPEMIAQARREHPDLSFAEGTITALDLADESLGGIVAWFSTIHTPPAELPRVFSEFHRVLAPGGHLLIAFQACDGDTPQPFDHRVTLAYRWPLDALSALLRTAGLIEVARLHREASEHERFPAGHLLLRKP
ncbi:class I SAM-dependent methyltransferase [Actinomadura sp. KC06]|uniref:class I SAM-dependent methyltransferase n=1 Tax=Actinomadura sp. KC06 TaxID=2530369 RepID=UPI00104F5DD0|nr:class I SAM-dependent methyltransferase [Actinomadura sp. KC06]TDD24137.1 class I SAM-dependent methyltransferase [Actinomadura sp. KC06]